MSKDMEPIHVSVDSSHALRNKEQETLLRERLLSGFDYRFFVPIPLFYSLDVQLKRERPLPPGRPWFAIDREDFDMENLWARYDIRVFPPILEEERRRLRVMRPLMRYPEGFELHEGDYLEILGFYLKMRVMRHESVTGMRREVMFQKNLLSELRVLPYDDQLLSICTEHYATDVLLPRFVQGTNSDLSSLTPKP